MESALYDGNQDWSGRSGYDSNFGDDQQVAGRGCPERPYRSGRWNGDSFGSLQKGDTLTSGYYVYIQPLEEQAQSDREARKAPPIKVAIKLRGAIHFIDATLTINR